MMKQSIDIAANRQSTKYSLCEQLARVAWAPGALLFRLTPRPLHGVRCGILRLFGARVGRDVHIYPSVRILLPWQLEIGDQSAIGDGAIIYNVGTIAIGSRTTVSQYAHLCAGSHDYRDPAFSLLRLPITIGDEAWICADAFVGPGVCIGDRAIVGARAVASKHVPSGMIVVGNPARVVKSRDPRVLESTSDASP
jgi:putative colanic acid biosynthesis acetyltransferase WcaF